MAALCRLLGPPSGAVSQSGYNHILLRFSMSCLWFTLKSYNNDLYNLSLQTQDTSLLASLFLRPTKSDQEYKTHQEYQRHEKTENHQKMNIVPFLGSQDLNINDTSSKD